MIIYLSMIESQEDRDKFEAVYYKYRWLMFRAANQIVANPQDAEDAVHQAFVSIIENLDHISDVESPKTRSYVVIITEHKAIDMMRRAARAQLVSLEDWGEGLQVPPPGDYGLADAMARLPAHYRHVLLLRFDNGYSVREIATLLEISISGVHKIIGRARVALRAELEQEGITP